MSDDEKEPYIPEPKNEMGPVWEDVQDQAEELRRRVADDTLLPWMILVMLAHLNQSFLDAFPGSDSFE